LVIAVVEAPASGGRHKKPILAQRSLRTHTAQIFSPMTYSDLSGDEVAVQHFVGRLAVLDSGELEACGDADNRGRPAQLRVAAVKFPSRLASNACIAPTTHQVGIASIDRLEAGDIPCWNA
jgi:hypothetical protein